VANNAAKTPTKAVKVTGHIWRESDRKIVVAIKGAKVINVKDDHRAYKNLDSFLQDQGR
jgi:hypothetical protein